MRLRGTWSRVRRWSGTCRGVRSSLVGTPLASRSSQRCTQRCSPSRACGSWSGSTNRRTRSGRRAPSSARSSPSGQRTCRRRPLPCTAAPKRSRRASRARERRGPAGWSSGSRWTWSSCGTACRSSARSPTRTSGSGTGGRSTPCWASCWSATMPSHCRGCLTWTLAAMRWISSRSLRGPRRSARSRMAWTRSCRSGRAPPWSSRSRAQPTRFWSPGDPSTRFRSSWTGTLFARRHCGSPPSPRSSLRGWTTGSAFSPRRRARCSCGRGSRWRGWISSPSSRRRRSWRGRREPRRRARPSCFSRPVGSSRGSRATAAEPPASSGSSGRRASRATCAPPASPSRP
mmetsp:Transcript_59506/g.186636  ORF Transcript_59506/g.186636 Transcript_59506/m.186636 type:complete len:344 (+) Transcript_59506:716-1747(+)